MSLTNKKYLGMESTGFTTDEFVVNGGQVNVSYFTGDQSVHSNLCKVCGKEYLIKGILGGIREALIAEDTCLECEKS